MKYLVCLLCLTGTLAFGQKKALRAYKPVTNVNIEQAFPAAAAVLIHTNYAIEDIDWGRKEILSSQINYRRFLFLHMRAKYLINIDDSNELNVDLVGIQRFTKKKGWVDARELAQEKRIKAAAAYKIEVAMNDPRTANENHEWFYKDLMINSKFFAHATSLGGKLWFNTFLKDRKVFWKLNFEDVKENQDYNYKYVEYYGLSQPSMTKVPTNFTVDKYTNFDKNAFSSKNSYLAVEGYCRSLLFVDGNFFISLTDSLDTPVPVNSVQAAEGNNSKDILDNASKLEKLKTMLDKGILTPDEFEAAKKKLIGTVSTHHTSAYNN